MATRTRPTTACARPKARERPPTARPSPETKAPRDKTTNDGHPLRDLSNLLRLPTRQRRNDCLEEEEAYSTQKMLTLQATPHMYIPSRTERPAYPTHHQTRTGFKGQQEKEATK